MAQGDGIEPPTKALWALRSTTELLGCSYIEKPHFLYTLFCYVEKNAVFYKCQVLESNQGELLALSGLITY